MESPKNEVEGTSQEKDWTVVDRPAAARTPLPKSTGPLSSSLNALRRTRSRNDPQPTTDPSPPLTQASRSNSWASSLARKASTKSSTSSPIQQQRQATATDSPTSTTNASSSSGDRDLPTPPSPAGSSSSRSSTNSHDTVTPPASTQHHQQGSGGSGRVLSTLVTLASPSTYYKPAARLFRPSSSSSNTNNASRPSTANSTTSNSNSLKLSPFPSIQPPAGQDMSGFVTRSADMSTEELDRHADQLILAAIQRTKGTSLTRTDSNASTSSQSRLPPNSQPPAPSTTTADSSPTSSALHHSASAPVVPLAPPRTSWFGFSSGVSKEEKKQLKEEKRGRKSRPTSETFTSPIFSAGSRPTSSSGRPSTGGSSVTTPLASPQVSPMQIKGSVSGNNVAASGASLPNTISTIREGVPLTKTLTTDSVLGRGIPLTKTLTMDSVMTNASEDKRGRARARSSSPFRAFRSSRSRGAATEKEKEKDKKRDKSANRSLSPSIRALKRSESDVESDAESLGHGMRGRKKKVGVKVRRTAFDQPGGETEGEDEEEDEEEEWSDEDEDDEDQDDGFDPETTQNTEANATPMDPEVCLSIEGGNFPGYDDDIELPDPLGEGVNVIRPEAPMFAQTLMAHTRPASSNSPARTRNTTTTSTTEGGSGTSPTTSIGSGPLTPAQVAARTPKKKKTLKSLHGTFGDPLPLNVSRPHFTRDRCTVVIKHGHDVPQSSAVGGGIRDRSNSNSTTIREGVAVGDEEVAGVWKREPKRYVVFSDMSEESKWAVEWGIGTVLRDGDEMILVTVQETDSKLDPAEGATVDRLQKLRNQQERQALASLLVRQATSLLQRTKLNVTVTCQAMHAKNARRLFLDIIDLLEPTLVIVGSRGLGKLKGILLGSTSHYLIQKSSVPVMVARRRLKRPTRKSHTAAQAIALRSEKKVSLAEARIEKMSSGQGKGATGVDVEDIQREHEQAEKEWPRIPGEEDEEGVVEEEDEEDEEEQAEGQEGVKRTESPVAERADGVSDKVAGD